MEKRRKGGWRKGKSSASWNSTKWLSSLNNFEKSDDNVRAVKVLININRKMIS